MIEQIDNILEKLNEKKEFYTKSVEGELAKSILKISRMFLWFSAFVFIVLCVFALAVSFFHIEKENRILPVAIILIFQYLAAIGWMVLEMTPFILSLIFHKTYMFRIVQLEMDHDMRNTVDLHQFDLASLRLAEKWLALKIERIKSRLIIILGGSDKIAILTLSASAWVIWKNFPTPDQSWQHQVYLYVSAFLGGLVIGGMFMNALIHRLAYQKDLLSLVIIQMEEDLAPDVEENEVPLAGKQNTQPKKRFFTDYRETRL